MSGEVDGLWAVPGHVKLTGSSFWPVHALLTCSKEGGEDAVKVYEREVGGSFREATVPRTAKTNKGINKEHLLSSHNQPPWTNATGGMLHYDIELLHLMAIR